MASTGSGKSVNVLIHNSMEWFSLIIFFAYFFLQFTLFVDVSIIVDDDVPEEIYTRNDKNVSFLPLVETGEKNVILQWIVTMNDTVIVNESRPRNNSAYASKNKFLFEFKEVSY